MALSRATAGGAGGATTIIRSRTSTCSKCSACTNFARRPICAACCRRRLPQPFHTGHLAEGLGVERWIAQRMAYCLRETGAIQSVGKLRGAWLYEQPFAKAA